MKVGDKVKWHDVAIADYGNDKQIAEQRKFEVIAINNDTNANIPDILMRDDDIILISDGYTEVECYITELEYI